MEQKLEQKGRDTDRMKGRVGGLGTGDTQSRPSHVKGLCREFDGVRGVCLCDQNTAVPQD